MTRFDASLKCILELITFLHDRLGNEVSVDNFGSSFSDVDLGGIDLDQEEYRAYANCIGTIKEELEATKLSTRLFEQALQKAILKSLDPKGKMEETPFSERLDTALSELKAFLLAKPEAYVCNIPVSGLSKEGLPFSIGKTQFIVADDIFLERANEKIERHTHDIEVKKRELPDFLRWAEIAESVLAVVEVSAKDYRTAEKIAVSQLRESLDIINFFSTSYINERSWAYLPGDAISQNLYSVIFKGDSFNLGANTLGPMVPLSLPSLLEDNNERMYGLEYLMTILESTKPTDFQKNLITAIQWAGRAQCTLRREEAFLMFITSLESIFIPVKGGSIVNRLGLYIPLVIGRGAEFRLELRDKVKRLYDTRSKIVHDGRRDISDFELDEVRRIVKLCIYQLSTAEKYRDVKGWSDLDRILTEQAFS